MTESEITRRMIRAFRARGAWAVKIHGGPHQTRGLPDILACYKGQMIGIEVKRPNRKNTVTPIQERTLRDLESSGAVALILTRVDSVGRLLDILDARDRKG